ncbi:hypothetical protein ATB96_01725 [Elizabethkingia ursingii]|nr:hypothetical protein ATB96_01725 [Elizabethkingia ursingii]
MPLDEQASPSQAYCDILLAHYKDMGIELLQGFSNPFAFLNIFRGVCILDVDDKEMFLGGLGITQECKFNIVFTCERVNRIWQNLKTKKVKNYLICLE